MTLTLTLVRHGQTHFNARQILQGSSNSPLTRTGREGVRATARHLAASTFTAAYTSPAGRAVATAVEIVHHHPGLTLKVDNDLREYDFGRFERHPERLLEAYEPWADLVPAVLAGHHPGLPGGEPGAAYMARVTAAFDRIVSAHDDDPSTDSERGAEVLVVGHGLTLGAYLWMVQRGGLPALPNASVSTVRVTEGLPEVVEVGLDIAGHGLPAARPALAPIPAAAPAPGPAPGPAPIPAS